MVLAARTHTHTRTNTTNMDTKSNRSQRRQAFITSNSSRIERLLETYGTSEGIEAKIHEIESRGEFSGKDVRELEALHAQVRVLKEYERVNEKVNDKVKKDEERKVEEEGDGLFKKSAYFDGELNPTGRAIMGLQRAVKARRGLGVEGLAEWNEPFESNVEESDKVDAYPREDKPRFYRVGGYSGVYGSGSGSGSGSK